MINTSLNIIIVAENALVAHGLKNELREKYSSAISTTCVCDFKTLLKTVTPYTDVIVVDPMVEGKKGKDVLRSAKLINPNVSGIFHTSSADVIEILDGMLHHLPHASGQESYKFAFN